MEEEHKCVSCREIPNYKCEQCTKLLGSATYLCESCWGKVHFLPLVSNHTKTQLSAAKTPGPSYVCSTHKKKLRLFCLTDDVFVCTSCAFSLNHKGHNIISLEEHCEKKKNETVEFLKNLRNMGAPLTESLTSIDFVSRAILEVHGRFEESIHKEFSEVISMLQKREEYLILESKTISTQKCTHNSPTTSSFDALWKWRDWQNRECVNLAMRHIEFYQKKFQLTVEKGNQHQIVERSSKIPAVLKVVSLNKEDLLPNTTELVTTSTSDILKVKSAISSLYPVIKSISRVGTEGGTTTISGTWCPTATNQDITVVIDQRPCTEINLADPGSTLTCSVPSGVGTNLGVTMTVLGVPTVHEHTPLFSYSGPVIQSVTPVQPGGEKAVITGTGFGDSPGAISVTVGDFVCRDVVLSKPHKEVTCTFPTEVAEMNAGNTAKMIVSVGGQRTESLVSFLKEVILTLKAWGAGGGGGEYCTGNHGGGGGFATARYAALPGEVLHVVVGRGGGCAPDYLHRGGGGAPNGGHGGTNCEAGGGGGSTHITARRFGNAVVLGAGGGGGGSGGKYCAGGGGGGGGTLGGVVGKGGMGYGAAADPPGSTTDGTPGQSGGGSGALRAPTKDGRLSINGRCDNGAGGLGGGAGGGGDGGSASCTHVIEGTFAAQNSQSQEGANWGDPDSTKANGNKAGRGGNHGRGNGEDGRAVIVIEGSGKLLVFDQDGDFTVTE
ncbi:tripartite motif-containing protein 35 [Pelomyxa schiedti]|nr:tripartite motif-containing protein 35 [Pelomyxa schiedti]